MLLAVLIMNTLNRGKTIQELTKPSQRIRHIVEMYKG